MYKSIILLQNICAENLGIATVTDLFCFSFYHWFSTQYVIQGNHLTNEENKKIILFL